MSIQWSDALKAIISAGVVDVVSDLSEANADAYASAYVAQHATLDDRVKKQISKDVQAWAGQSADSMVGTLQDQLTNMIQNGYDNQVHPFDLADDIDDLFEDRGELIARTETAKAVNTGRFAGSKDAGDTHKQWIHGSISPMARESHQELDDMGPIPIDQPYSTDLSDSIMYPGDPDADVGDLCNCGCVLVTSREDSEDNDE